jgi:hypothetical protein
MEIDAGSGTIPSSSKMRGPGNAAEGFPTNVATKLDAVIAGNV